MTDDRWSGHITLALPFSFGFLPLRFDLLLVNSTGVLSSAAAATHAFVEFVGPVNAALCMCIFSGGRRRYKTAVNLLTTLETLAVFNNIIQRLNHLIGHLATIFWQEITVRTIHLTLLAWWPLKM